MRATGNPPMRRTSDETVISGVEWRVVRATGSPKYAERLHKLRWKPRSRACWQHSIALPAHSFSRCCASRRRRR